MERNGDDKLVLFIAFTVERNAAQVLIAGGLQERTGNRKQRRRLVEMPVKSAKNAVQFGNPQRCTEAQTGGILNRAPGKVRLAKAGIKREPRCCFELLLPVDRRERSIRAMSFGIDVAEELAWRARIIGIEGNLIEIASRLGDEAQLVVRIRVVDQRSEAAEAVRGIVNHGRGGSLQPEIGAVSVHAGVIGEAIGVAAEVELVVGLVKIAGA